MHSNGLEILGTAKDNLATHLLAYKWSPAPSLRALKMAPVRDIAENFPWLARQERDIAGIGLPQLIE